MRTLWVGGLVLALGWLSVTAGDSESEAQPTPMVARASEPAKPALLDGVALGKPILVTLVEPRAEPRTIAVSAAPARIEAGTVNSLRSEITARYKSPDDPPPPLPAKNAAAESLPEVYVERGIASETDAQLPAEKGVTTEASVDATRDEKVAVNAPGEPTKQDAGPEESGDDGSASDPPKSKVTTKEPSQLIQGDSEFATGRPAMPAVKVRAVAESEPDDGFAVERPQPRRSEVKPVEIKPVAHSESSTAKQETAHPVVARGIIARAKDLLHPSAKDKEKKAVAGKVQSKAAVVPDAKNGAKPTAAPPTKESLADGEQVSDTRKADPAPAKKEGTSESNIPATPKDDVKASADSDAGDELPKDTPAKLPAKFLDKPGNEVPAPRNVPVANNGRAAELGKPTVCCTQESRPYPGQLYGSAEYLVWFTKADHVPPLVTTGASTSSGILGQPGTALLFGGPGTNLNENVRQGGRFTLGYWLDPCHECAIEASYFFLGDHTQSFSANSNQFPLLARPFFRVNTGSEFSEIVTRPDVATGSVTIQAPTKLWGAEANVRHPLCCGCSYRVDGLAGFRYLDLREAVDITENVTTSPTQPAFPNSHVVVSDQFDTHNQFYGGQVGVDGEVYFGRFFLGLRGKVALGDNHETLNINGSQLITDAQGNLHVFRGGLLALQSNMGHFSRDRFAVVPELGLSIGCQLTDQLRFTVGYNLLYWSDVIRPGEQIDRVIDETLIPNFGAHNPPAGQNRPTVLFKQSDFWAQGLTFGLEYKY
jgi:hypothetical protein